MGPTSHRSEVPSKLSQIRSCLTHKPDQPGACTNSNFLIISQWESLKGLKASGARHMSYKTGKLGLSFPWSHVPGKVSWSRVSSI